MVLVTMMETAKPKKRIFFVTMRVFISAVVLALGILGMNMFANMKTPPAKMKHIERPLQVEAMRAETEDVPVFMTGYGEVKALDIVNISPEVSGKIVEIHPRLEVGELIPKGETLFKIDVRDYKAAVDEADAMVAQWTNTIERLKKQQTIARKRLQSLERNEYLAKDEFERVRRLYRKDKVGTRSGVDATERAYNTASNVTDQIREAVELYPIRIKEAKNSRSAARARLTLAKARLDRCRVVAPFDCRIKAVSLETGQYVSPGQDVLTLANDAVLEIHVSLDSRDARKWLRFNGRKTNSKTAWFNSLEPVTCKIRWTEDRARHTWEGALHRVVEFSHQTRTLTVAVRVEAREAFSKGTDRLPLVEGMFCLVDIPGRVLKNVIRLPRWVVSFENKVFVARNRRLKTVPVEVARIEGEQAYISAGLNPGDIIITTRLIDPLENSLLEISNQTAPDSRS